MKSSINSDKYKVRGIVQAGYGVASGRGTSPYPAGTIDMQRPFFLQMGLDLNPYYSGTLNVSIAPLQWMFIAPSYTFSHVEWTEFHPPETFSFEPCELVYNGQLHTGLIYYPHPETKQVHHQATTILELLMPAIAKISYGATVQLSFSSTAIKLEQHYSEEL